MFLILIVVPFFFFLQIPVSPGNWSDSTAFLATVLQPNEDNLSTITPEITEHKNSTIATILEINRTKSTTPVVLNQTAPYNMYNKFQQDQCWETYVGQVGDSTGRHRLSESIMIDYGRKHMRDNLTVGWANVFPEQCNVSRCARAVGCSTDGDI